MFDPDENHTNLHCIVKAGQRREKVNFSRGLARTRSWLAPGISRSYQWRAVDAGGPILVLRGLSAFGGLPRFGFFRFSWGHQTPPTLVCYKTPVPAAAH